MEKEIQDHGKDRSSRKYQHGYDCKSGADPAEG